MSYFDDGLAALLKMQPEAIRDPYPLFNKLRDEAPVYRYGPRVYVSRLSDVHVLSRDESKLSKATDGTDYEEPLKKLSGDDAEKYKQLHTFERAQLSRMDGPDHDRLRNCIRTCFTPQRIELMRDHIGMLAARMLDELEGVEKCDLVQSFTYRLPLQVIVGLMGVEPEHADSIHDWSEHVMLWRADMANVALIHRAYDSMTQFRDLVRGLIADVESGRKQATELVAACMDAKKSGQMNEPEMISMFVMLLLAGHETTMNLIGNGLLNLLQNPDQMQLLRQNPSLIGTTVEEVLRYDPPTQWMSRMAKDEFVLHDVRIPPGQTMILLIAAANRDPSGFKDPQKFDITRSPNRHLGFGFGLHFCMGAALARMEAQIAINGVLARWPDLALEDSRLEWRRMSRQRGVEALPVALGRRAASAR